MAIDLYEIVVVELNRSALLAVQCKNAILYKLPEQYFDVKIQFNNID